MRIGIKVFDLTDPNHPEEIEAFMTDGVELPFRVNVVNEGGEEVDSLEIEEV